MKTRIKTLLLTFALCCMFAVQGYSQVGDQHPSGYIVSWTGYDNNSRGHFKIRTFSPKQNQDAQEIVISIGSPSMGQNTCTVMLYQNVYVMLLNNVANDWSGWYGVGTANSTENGQCIVTGTSRTVLSIWEQEFDVDITFKQPFNGSRAVSGWSADASWVSAQPWRQNGSFQVNGVSSYPLPTTELVSMTPGGSSTTQTFTFRSVYQGGAANIGWSWFGVDTGVNWPGANICSFAFYPGYYGGLQYSILNDNGQAASYYMLGSPGENGKCKITGTSMSLGGNVATYHITVEAKAGFSGNMVITGFSAKYPNEYGSVLYLGNWTIPATQDEIIGYVKESPSTLNPGEVNMSRVTLSQAGQNLDTMALRVYHVGDPVTFRIRFGRPNQQVWVQRRAMRFTDGAWIEEVLCSPTVGISGHEVDGACLLGYTDSTGFFEWNSQILNSLIGMTTVQFYLGGQATDPAYPTTTYGPMNDDNYIGALVYFVIGVSGFPQPPIW